MRIADFPRPDTAAARAAVQIATTYHTPSLLNHVQRSWLWAEGFAVLRGFEPDHELLYVSALLHDLGITPEFDNATLAYEDAAGHVAIGGAGLAENDVAAVFCLYDVFGGFVVGAAKRFLPLDIAAFVEF